MFSYISLALCVSVTPSSSLALTFLSSSLELSARNKPGRAILFLFPFCWHSFSRNLSVVVFVDKGNSNIALHVFRHYVLRQFAKDHPRGTHSRYVIGCCLIPLGICGLKNNSRRITYVIVCVWGMPSLSPLSSLDLPTWKNSKNENRENVSRARDSLSAIIAYSDRYPPYIDLQALFVSSSKLIHVMRYDCKTKKKIRENALHRKGWKSGHPHNITINNKLNFHYLP